MELNQTLLKILEILSKIDTVKDTVSVSNGSISIADFIKIDNETILVNNENVEEKIILPNAENSNPIEVPKFEEFIKQLSPNILRLNHVGISYFCKDLNQEIEHYKNLLKNSDLNLYEENSGMAEKKWIFIGDNTNWQDALFELILVESAEESQNVWLPDFQIDIDTTLGAEEIKEIANRTIRKDFIDWEFDIPNYGSVLCSGILGNINGAKISVGIGTKLRDPKYQRENLVKLN